MVKLHNTNIKNTGFTALFSLLQCYITEFMSSYGNTRVGIKLSPWIVTIKYRASRKIVADVIVCVNFVSLATQLGMLDRNW